MAEFCLSTSPELVQHPQFLAFFAAQGCNFANEHFFYTKAKLQIKEKSQIHKLVTCFHMITAYTHPTPLLFTQHLTKSMNWIFIVWTDQFAFDYNMSHRHLNSVVRHIWQSMENLVLHKRKRLRRSLTEIAITTDKRKQNSIEKIPVIRLRVTIRYTITSQ